MMKNIIFIWFIHLDAIITVSILIIWNWKHPDIHIVNEQDERYGHNILQVIFEYYVVLHGKTVALSDTQA